MWPSKFSRVNKELIIDRIGKNPYSRELSNLIFTRIDMETTFMHHALPGAIDFLRELFGDVEFGSSYTSALEVLKSYYKEGEKLYKEYISYLGDIGAVNISDENRQIFLKEKEGLGEMDASYGGNLMKVYDRYQYSLFNIVRLDEKIAEMQLLEDEYEKELLENKVVPKRTGVAKILDYFGNIKGKNK